MLMKLDCESMNGEIKWEKWGRLYCSVKHQLTAAVEAEQAEMIKRH